MKKVIDMKQENYARLLIRVGLAVKQDQIVVIKGPVEAYDFIRALTKEAFQAGAKDVIVRYNDQIVSHEKALYTDENLYTTCPSYEADFYNQTSFAGACYLSLVGQDPDLMQDVDSHRLAAYAKAFRTATKAYRNRLDFMECQWCVAAVATPGWAKKVYPNLSEELAIQKLWEDIYKVCQIDQRDPVDTWQARKEDFQKKVQALNALHLVSLHYINALGTDCTIELPKGYQFAGGCSTLKDGTDYFANLPTEEVFSAPLKNGVNGKLVASYPLNHNGALIEDFWFEFKDGKVIDYGAKKGKEVLDSILSSDENAAYLGEIALVSYDSTISSFHQIFYETLIDENASCHFALGQSYAECLQGGLDKDAKQLEANGLNQSMVHVDFMVGTKDLEITGITAENQVISLFEKGCFSPAFTKLCV